MAQIIAFPSLPAAFGARTAGLANAGSVSLIAVRWWAAASKDADNPLPRPRGAMESGDTDAAERVLRTALLSAQGADFMMLPPGAAAGLFACARLVFRRGAGAPGTRR